MADTPHVASLKYKEYTDYVKDHNYRTKVQSKYGSAARTEAFKFTPGVINWYSFCGCQNKCGERWRLSELLVIKYNFINLDDDNKDKYFVTHNTTDGKVHHFFLKDVNGEKHACCKDFFCRVLGVNKTTVSSHIKWMENDNKDPTLQYDQRGKYERKPEHLADRKGFDDWLGLQKKELSHYCRNERKPVKYYMNDFRGFAEMWDAYEAWCKSQNRRAVNIKTIRDHWIENYKGLLYFKRTHADSCISCTRLYTLEEKISKLADGSTKDGLTTEMEQIKKQHLEESDERYRLFEKEKLACRSGAQKELKSLSREDQDFYSHTEPTEEGESMMEDDDDRWEDDEEDYEIEKIVKYKYNASGINYLIKWIGHEELQWVHGSLIRKETAGIVLKVIKTKKWNETWVGVKDMQKELLVPKLHPQPTDYYRKRKLNLHNLGVYNCKLERLHCYLWDEYTGFKTADEMCSILWKMFKSHNGAFKIYKLWSDNCVAQNTCWKLFWFYSACVRRLKLKKIVINTFVVGHTFTTCDSYFGAIDTKSNRKQVETPEQWKNLMDSVVSVEAEVLKQEDLLNWDWLKDHYTRNKKDIDGNNVGDIRGFFSYSFFNDEETDYMTLKMKTTRTQLHPKRTLRINKMNSKMVWKEVEKYDEPCKLKRVKVEEIHSFIPYLLNTSHEEMRKYYPHPDGNDLEESESEEEDIRDLEHELEWLKKRVKHIENSIDGDETL